MKKIATLFIVLAILLSLCACGTNTPNTSQYTGENTNDKSNYTEDIELDEGPVPGAYPVTPVTEVPDGYVGIYTVNDLLRINSNTSMNYILMEDLDLSSYPDWEGLSNDAHFDGNGHTISNLTSTKSGLFEKCNEISGIILENVKIDFDNISYSDSMFGNYHIGAVANNVTKSVTGCSATGYISIRELNDYTSVNFCIGGVVGYAKEAIISSCTNEVEVFYDTYEVCKGFVDVICGGIVGVIECEKNTGRISCCVNNAEIYAFAYTEHDDGLWLDYQGFCGGIVGEITPSVTIDTCLNFGDVTSSVVASGIVATTTKGGYTTTFIVSDCVNVGKIEISKEKGRTYPTYKLGHKASGIIGELNDSKVNINSCYNFGEICGDFVDAGSLIAHSETDKITIKNCICVNNLDYNNPKISMDGKEGMYPESYNNKEISLTQAKEQFSQYFAD